MQLEKLSLKEMTALHFHTLQKVAFKSIRYNLAKYSEDLGEEKVDSHADPDSQLSEPDVPNQQP